MIFTGTDVQRVGGAAAGGSGDMDNIILGTSLACPAGVAAAFWADLRALRARERAMRSAEFSWGPNGHELRVVLPGLRRPKSPRSSRTGSRRPCLSSRPCFSCSSGSVSRLIVSLLAWCTPAAGGAVLRNAPTHRPGSGQVRPGRGPERDRAAIRTSSFSLEFTRSLHGAIDEQARLGYDPAHEVAVEAMVRQYSTDQLWHCCQVRCST